MRHSMPLADAPPSIVHFSKSRRARIHLFPSSFIFFPPIPGPTALEGFASVRPRHFWEREREKRTSDCLCGTADGWMDRPRSPRASSSPIHFSDFLRLIGERERMEWTMEWRINEVRNPFPGCELRALFFCRPCLLLKIMDVGEMESEKANQIQSGPLLEDNRRLRRGAKLLRFLCRSLHFKFLLVVTSPPCQSFTSSSTTSKVRPT